MAIPTQAGAVQVVVDFERLLQQHNAASEWTNDAPDLKSALSTAALGRRRSRPPDHAAENRAQIALMQELATSPHGILTKLAETAMAMCHSQSAGISLLNDDKTSFHWPVIVGKWACHSGGGTPRDYGPCGTVLDRNAALLFSHPERDFSYFAPITPMIEEALLIPFHVDRKAVGTIWVIVHDHSWRFDAEDLRLMNNLGIFASAAYQTLLCLNAAQRTASIIESSDDAIVSKDIDGIITTWNTGAERLYGYTAKEIIGRPLRILIPPDLRAEEFAIHERIQRGERIAHYETVRMCKHGRLIDISLTVSPIKDLDGKIIGASKIARDNTARKRSEEQILAIAHEAEHRTKNVLATVQATVRLTQSDTSEGFKHAIVGRIQALANVHTLFVQSRWTGAELHSLVTQELLPYCQSGATRARIDGPNVLLEPNTAQTIAMTLHELATNAAKYGALSVPEGYVQVEWSRAADGRLILRWAETDGPLVKPPTRRGFGTRVMERMIQGQLKGEIRFDWRAEGLTCEIALPA